MGKARVDGAGVACAWTALLALPAKADAVADFYRGKTVTLVVGYGPGGGYDVYARLVGRHLGRHIPGNPTVVVQNMPGAGSLRSVNWLNNLAPNDGTAIAHFARNMPLMGMLGNNSQRAVRSAQVQLAGLVVELRQRRLHPDRAQGHPGEDHRRCAPAGRRSAGARRHRGRRDRQRRADHPARHHRAQRQAGGGLSRYGAIFLAMERGEVHGRTTDLSSVKAIKPEWLKPNSGFHVLVQFARETRHQDFPNVPTARELARNESLAAADRAHRNSLQAVAAVCGAARHSGGARGGAAAARSRPPIATRNILPTPPSSGSTSARSTPSRSCRRSSASKARRNSSSTTCAGCSRSRRADKSPGRNRKA